jgi:hypothetical protein
MLIGLTELKTYQIISGAESIGRLADVLFSRGEWTARYVVVDSDDLGRKISLPISCLHEPDRNARTIQADVDLDRVETSPDVDLSKDVERQAETDLYEHYGWPPYWLQDEQDVNPTGILSGEAERKNVADQAEFISPELQLATKVLGAYAVHANEGEFGVLQDVLVEVETWMIENLAVDTPQKQGCMLLETDSVSEVDWVAGEIYVALPAATLLASPVYHAQEPLTPEFERRLHGYYDRIKRPS